MPKHLPKICIIPCGTDDCLLRELETFKNLLIINQIQTIEPKSVENLLETSLSLRQFLDVDLLVLEITDFNEDADMLLMDVVGSEFPTLVISRNIDIINTISERSSFLGIYSASIPKNISLKHYGDLSHEILPIIVEKLAA